MTHARYLYFLEERFYETFDIHRDNHGSSTTWYYSLNASGLCELSEDFNNDPVGPFDSYVAAMEAATGMSKADYNSYFNKETA